MIFGSAMIAMVFFMSAFLFPANVLAVDVVVSAFGELKTLLEDANAPEILNITISESADENDLMITSQIEVSASVRELVIHGNGKTLDGDESSPFLKVSNIKLTLDNITIENCRANSRPPENHGAVIYAEEDTAIALMNSKFNNNIAETGSGGVVYQKGGSEDTIESNKLTISNCSFTENGNEWFDGGVVYQFNYASIDINESSFTENYSEESGGAIYQGDYCRMVIDGETSFKGNYTNYAGGGAIYQGEHCALTINGAVFSENAAYDQGGAIYQHEGSELNVSGSVFTGNEAADQGGAIYQVTGAMTVQDCQFLGNESDAGGAIYAPTRVELIGSGSTDQEKKCLFKNNKAYSFGGALLYDGDLTITGCTFEENEAWAGGALAAPWGRSFLIDADDGKYYFTQEGLVGTTDISNSDFIGNHAEVGGAWYQIAGFEEEIYGEDTPVYYDEDAGKYYFLTIEELLPVVITNPDDSDTRITEAGIKIYFDEGCGNKITVSGTEFRENYTSGNGGVLFLENLLTTEIKEVTVFDSNHAKIGGVIYNKDTGPVTISKSEFTNNYAEETDAICYSTTDGSVSFDGSTFTGNTVKNSDGWVFSLNGASTVMNNEFYANTDTQRDMLFKDASDDDKISGNTYRGNFLKDAFSSPAPNAEIEYSPEFEITLDLREVYQDDVRDGVIRISINENIYNDFAVTDGKAVITINKSDLKDGDNSIKAQYISGEYKEGEYTSGYYHYQQPELTFTIKKAAEIYNVTVTTEGNGTAIANPESGTTGTQVTLTAEPGDGWKFKEWKLIESGGGTLNGDTFTIGTGDAEIKAVFEEELPEEYHVIMTVDGNGTAIANPGSGPTGTQVTLTAEPGDGWKFKEWTVIESGSGTLNGDTFTIGTGDAEIQAVFEEAEEPQPPEPPMPIYPLCCELPRTGITGAGISLKDKPASLNYDPIGMELYIPVLDLVSDIVTVPQTDDGYPVEWLGMNAGLLEGFAKPGSGISVIAGHNTLNAEEYGPFALLNTLEVGDVLFVRSSNGELKSFTVYLNEKIGAADIEGLQQAAGMYDNTLTLLTCEDEMSDGGYASRRIISAK